MSHISIKKRHGLTYLWAAHKEAHAGEDLHDHVRVIIDFPDFV